MYYHLFLPDSTVTGTDTSHLLILGLEPRDSKNYTCVPSMDVEGKLKNGSSYTHYVIGKTHNINYKYDSLR